MEENQKKQKSNGKTLFTVALSLFVAIAAIVSLVGVGFNQVSYAAPNDESGTSSGLESFIFKEEKRTDTPNVAMMIKFANDDDFFMVPVYYREENGVRKPVFCVEHDIQPGVDQTYNKINGVPGNLTDKTLKGVLYILRQSKVAFGDTASGISKVNDELVESAATQAAIWAYLYDAMGGNYPHSLKMEDDPDTVVPASKRSVIDTFQTYTLVRSASDPEIAAGDMANNIKKVVEAAKNYNGVNNTITLKKENSNITKTSDNKFYQSSKFTVTASEHIKGYTVSLSGVSGAIAVNEKGEVKTEFSPEEVFYVRVPVDKVTDKKQTIDVKVTGTFDGTLAGSYYGITGKQKVVTVTEVDTTEDAFEHLDVVKAPDTAMSSVQTIYFIGLVVLLCGIGIIYANAKPVEEK